MNKPKVFIASSSENIGTMEELVSQLSKVADITPWTKGSGYKKSGGFLLDALIEAPTKFDYAIAILGGDDLYTSRGVTRKAPRDNVIFELGLFISHLTRERTFILLPEGTNLLSDLTGLTVEEYKTSGNVKSDLKNCCKNIKETILRLKFYQPEMGPKSVTQIQTCLNDLIHKERRGNKKIEIKNIALDMEVTWSLIRDTILEKEHIKNISCKILMIDGNSDLIKQFSSPTVSCDMALTRENNIRTYFLENHESLQKRKINFEFKAYKELPTIHGFLFDESSLIFSICNIRNKKLLGSPTPYVKHEFRKLAKSNEASKYFVDAFNNWVDHYWENSRSIWPEK